jgi:stage II sporulation protein D
VSLIISIESSSGRAAAPGRRAPEPQRSGAAAINSDRAAILVMDLPSGRSLSVVQPDLIATRLLPGSVLKIATLIAALESGVISPTTTFTCRRRVTVDGRELVCAHPDLGRPMTPAEALAHSCNDFFVSIAARLPRERLSAATTALGLGPVSAGASVPLAAVGLDGIEATPEQLLRALVRAIDPSAGVRLRPETRAVLLEGLRGAARYGTARAIGDRGIDALAKTGTAPMPGGGYHGLALAVSPSARPSRAVVVVMPGGSGADAAAVLADTLAQLIEGTYGQAQVSEGPKVPASEAPAVRPLTRPGRGQPVEPKGPERPPQAGRPSGGTTFTGEMTIRVGHARAGGYDLVQVPLEDYVARVVAGEAAARSAPAALEALAIAVRTFAVANLGRHRNDGFDLCDLTHCQVMGTATAVTRQAAAATAGQILTYLGRPASIFYTACCGGQSELPSDVWPRAQNQPFLTRRKDAACRLLPPWTSEIAETELLRALRAAGFRGDTIRDLHVARRSGSGRAALVGLDGISPDEITGDDLRLAVGRTLGWQLLKSTAFDVKRTSSGYRFTGHGSGHGVGLCTIGSARMAAEGKSAAKILAEYFPGTKIDRLPAVKTSDDGEPAGPVTAARPPTLSPGPPPTPAPFPLAHVARAPGSTSVAAAPARPRTIDQVRIEIVLSVTAQRATGDLEKLVRQSLAEISGRARIPLPATIRLVFHPTVESYCRQTKLPWWTAAATSGDRIDLVPFSVLQERHIVEPTLRHEIAHILTTSSLEGRPVWVKEGAAIYLSGERVDPPAGKRAARMPCPTDDDLLRSQSAASLHEAYARAAGCYSAQIAAGKKWDEVR